MPVTEIGQDRIPNAVVEIDKNRKFLKLILMELPISHYSVNNISQAVEYNSNHSKYIAYNSISKTHGYTPLELVFGHTSSRPSEITLSIAFYFCNIGRRKTDLLKSNCIVGEKVNIKEIQNKLQSKFSAPLKSSKLIRIPLF